MSFVRDSAYSLASRAWMAASRGMAIVALSRALGPAEYGVYALVLNTYAIAGLVGTAGLEQASTYWAGRTPERVPQLVHNAIWLTLGLGAAVAVVFVPLALALCPAVFDAGAVRLVLEALAFVPLAILHNQLAGIVVGLGWFRYYAKSEVCKWTAYLLLSVILWQTDRLTVRSGLVAFYVAVAATLVLHAVVLRRRTGAAGGRWRLDAGLARDTLRYGWSAFGVGALNLLNFRFDLYLVKWFRSPADVGIYSLGANIAEVLLYCARSINVVVFSRVSSDARRSALLTPGVARVLVAAITVAVAAVLSTKDVLVLRILGEGFATCSNVVTLLLPGILAQSVTLLLVGDFLGRQALGTVMRSGLLCFTVMVGLDLLAIPSWGVLGAAAVSSLAYSVQAAHLLLRHSRSTGLSITGYLLVRRDDLVLVRERLRSLGSGAGA